MSEQHIPNCPYCGSPNTIWKDKAKNWECLSCEKRFEPADESIPHKLKIFLSYGHDENTALVERIKADLSKPENGGHDVWIDTSKIKFNDDWRRAITDGIHHSDLLLAFLSKHSVRDPGYCRDELAIALGDKGCTVSTVLVESSAEVKAPVSLRLTQSLDMHQWKEQKEKGTDAFEAWYAEKFAEIRRVLNDPTTQYFAGEIEYLAEKLTPVPYAARIGELLSKGFVGREWLVNEINNWREYQPEKRVFCITGEPGIGKSAIAAWLAHTSKAEVVAVHFCDYKQPNWSDPGQIIRSIAFQIASCLPDYRKFLIRQIDNLEKQAANSQQQQLQAYLPTVEQSSSETSQLQPSIESPKVNPLASLKPAELFDSLIANAAGCGIQRNNQRYLIIIDALDEAGAELAEFIAQRADSLPRWLAFLVTSRPGETAIMAHLEKLYPHIVQADDARNRDDLLTYINKWLETRGMNHQQMIAIAKPLLVASQGNFLYITTFRSFVESGGDEGQRALESPNTYPKGISSLYFSFFQRQFPKLEKYRAKQAPLLCLVAAARKPLPEAMVRQILKLDEETFNIEVLQPLGSLFNRQLGHLEPFHKSVRDWLSNDSLSQSFYVSANEGHHRLGETLWQGFITGCDQQESLSQYLLSELPYHLLKWPEVKLIELMPDAATWTTQRENACAIAEKLKKDWHGPDAEGWWRLISRLDERILGADHPTTAISLNNFAYLLNAQGRHDDAEPLLRRALAIREKTLGPEHPTTATTLNNLAELLRSQGKYDDAEPLYHRALAINKNTLGPNHPDTATSLSNLARLLYSQGKYDDAEPLLRGALAIREKTLGSEHRTTATTLNNLAKLLDSQGKYDDAEPLYRRALAIREKTLGPKHRDTARSLWDLGMLLISQGKGDEGLQMTRRSTAIWMKFTEDFLRMANKRLGKR